MYCHCSSSSLFYTLSHCAQLVLPAPLPRTAIRGEGTGKYGKERQHRKLADSDEEPIESTKPEITSGKMRQERLNRIFFGSPLWEAERGINRENGWGLKDWAAGDTLRRLCWFLQMPFCVQPCLFFFKLSFSSQAPVATLFYPFCLAQICQIIATNTWQQPRFTTSPLDYPFFLSLSLCPQCLPFISFCLIHFM